MEEDFSPFVADEDDVNDDHVGDELTDEELFELLGDFEDEEI